jgi:hypothetical protein
MLIKQSSSNRVIPFFMVSSTDHIAGKTGLTPTVTISKNGAAFAAPSGAIAEIGSGWYRIAGNATDSNTVGSLLVHATGTGADPYDVTHEVVVYDIDSSTVTVGTNNDKTGYNLVAAYDPSKTAAQAGNAMTLTTGERTSVGIAVRDTSNASPVAGSLGAEIKSGIAGDPWSTVLPGAYGANTAGNIIGNNLNATVSSRLASASYTVPPTTFAISTAVRDVDNTSPVSGSLGDKVNQGAAGGDPWAVAIPGSYGAGTAGNILGNRIDAAITTRLATAGYTVPPTTGAIATAVRDVDNQTPAANSLGLMVKNGSVDPWTLAVPGSYTAGQAGNVLGNRLDVATSTRLADSAYVPPPNANTIAAATRDVNNQTPAANSLGAAINAAASAGDPWSTALPGSYAAGTAGKIIGDRIDATVSSRLAAINYTVPPTKEVIALATRDVDNTTPPPPANSLGAKINAAASAGDPWSTTLPGSYASNTAGNILGNRLDALVSTRLAGASYTAPPDVPTIAAGVRDVNNQTPAALSLGAAINSAASAGDPWTAALPGAYASGTAGNIIGNRIDAAVTTRLASVSYTAPFSLTATAEAVRDVNNQTPATNSLGAAVNRAASAGDPWSAQLPNPAYGAGTAGKLISDNLNAPVTSRLATSGYTVPPNVSQIAAATRDVDNTSPVPGSMGDKINSAASAGDPWATFLPGSYAAGTAGDLIGNNMDAKVSTRLPTASYTQAPSAQIVAQSVRDIDNTAPATNSLGAAVNVSAAVGDPWTKVIPGSYGTGTAGKILGTNLDATVSSRSTYAGADTSGTTTLLSRIPSNLTITAGKVDVNDKTGYSLTADYDRAKGAAQPGDAMGLTGTERTTLTTSIWQYLTSLMTNAGTIGKLIVDNLNATISSRMVQTSYVAPDNTGIAAIKAKTDNLPVDPAGVSSIPTPAVTAAAVRDVSNATPVVGSLGADVKAGISILADPWSVNVPGTYGPGTAGNLLGNYVDARISSRLATSAIALSTGQVTVAVNNDKTGYGLTNGEREALADEILKRDWQQVSGESTYSVLNALRFLRDAWEVQPDGTLIVYKENGQVAWTRSVRADPEAQPIIGVS